MTHVLGIMIAKGASLRLPGKNTREFFGRPLYEWNLEKLLRQGIPVMFDSDDEGMLKRATVLGAVPHLRSKSLCGHDVPSVPLFQSIVNDAATVPGAILNLQANSPNCSELLVSRAVALCRHVAFAELLTVFPDRSNNGSLWGFSYERLMNYGDPYVHKPDVLLVDDAVDIHTEADLEAARQMHVSAGSAS